MKEYEVTIKVELDYVYIVDASNERDAKKEALNLYNYDIENNRVENINHSIAKHIMVDEAS